MPERSSAAGENPGAPTVLRILLGTADAHGLYARFGFAPVNAQRMMERRPPAG